MKDRLKRNLEYLTQLTKEEADLIEDVCVWSDDQKFAFLFAKKMFEEETDADES